MTASAITGADAAICANSVVVWFVACRRRLGRDFEQRPQEAQPLDGIVELEALLLLRGRQQRVVEGSKVGVPLPGVQGAILQGHGKDGRNISGYGHRCVGPAARDEVGGPGAVAGYAI